MASESREGGPSAGQITVRYWASARAAADTDRDVLDVTEPVSLADVTARVHGLHDTTRFRQLIATCSVLVGERPVASDDPVRVTVQPGETVEFLPPFAGG